MRVFPHDTRARAYTRTREPIYAGRRDGETKTGRPKKYSSKKALGDAIERYFRSISRTIPAKDDTGCIICNDDGERIMLTQYIRPPSISSLCIYLGIDRSTWQNYCDGQMYPEFAGVTSQTRARIEAYLEEQLLTRVKGVQGIIFNLQNNYGWRQKQEVELGDKTRETMPAASMSITEKIAVIAAAQAAAASHGLAEEEAGEET